MDRPKGDVNWAWRQIGDGEQVYFLGKDGDLDGTAYRLYHDENHVCLQEYSYLSRCWVPVCEIPAGVYERIDTWFMAPPEQYMPRLGPV